MPRTATQLIRFDSGTQMRRVGFALQLDAAGTEAKWQKVFPLGETRYRADFGSITFDRSFLEAMVRNYRAEGSPERPWDYFHRGQSDDALPREEKVASGWFSDMELRDDGLYVLTKWTDEAAALIREKKLRYPSPTFSEDAVDPKTGKPCGPKLFAVALLNDPFLVDLPPVKAGANPPAPKGTTMKLALAQLVAAAKLSADTTEDNIETALQMKALELDEAKAEVKKLKESAEKAVKDAETHKLAGDTIKAELTKLSAEVTKLQAANVALEKERAESALKALTDKLESEGRIIAADKERVGKLVGAMGLKEATEFCATWPVKVDLKEHGVGGEGVKNAADAYEKLNAVIAEVAKKEGIKLSDARLRVYAMAEHRPLVDAAAKLTSPVPVQN